VKCGGKRVSKYVKQAGTRTRKNPTTGEVETKAVPARILCVCLSCKKQFSVTEGTIFNDTHLTLDKWFMAVALMVNAKKGLSALQLKRDLKTAWHLSHRIRKAMGLCELADEKPLTGTVEIDETCMGSKAYDKRRKRGPYEKEPVFCLIEWGGRAKTVHMPRVTLRGIIENIKGQGFDANAIYPDTGQSCGTVPGCLRNGSHQTVNHSAKEWVRGDVHAGSIDGYRGLLKRGAIGSFPPNQR
jgi:hypothetical protein